MRDWRGACRNKCRARFKPAGCHKRYSVDRATIAKNGWYWTRRPWSPALTIFGLDDDGADASYETFAEIIRRSDNLKETLEDCCFVVLSLISCGNTDDHARNHAVSGNGKTPYANNQHMIFARKAGPAMKLQVSAGFPVTIGLANLNLCRMPRPIFQCLKVRGQAILQSSAKRLRPIGIRFGDEANLSAVDCNVLNRQFLNALHRGLALSAEYRLPTRCLRDLWDHRGIVSNYKMARPERFRIPDAWFEATYSIQLSYGRVSG